MIAALFRAVFLGFLIAGIVHVVAVLSIPDAAPNDAVERIGRMASTRAPTPIPADGSVLAGLDPFFVHAVCPIDVADGPIEVSGDMPNDVWSIAVVSGTGSVAGSLDRGSVADDRLDLVVGNAVDIDAIRRERAETGRPVVAIAVPGDSGFVLVRAFAGRRNRPDDLRDMLGSLSCRPARQ